MLACVAWIRPLCLRVPAKMPTASPLSVPRLMALSVGACTSKVIPSRPLDSMDTAWPATKVIAPLGASTSASTPVDTLEPINTTSPLRPNTLPCTDTAPPGVLALPKRRRPVSASASDMRRADAVKPAVSTTAPALTVMPDWLTSTRLPLLPRVPKSCEGVLVTTRFIEVLPALGCRK